MVALVSLTCVDSGEASTPEWGLSSTSEDASVVAMSSPELHGDPKLSFGYGARASA